MTDLIRSAAAPLLGDGWELARVITGVRDHYRVVTEQGEFGAYTTGRFLYSADDSTDLPVAGDWAVVRVVDDTSIIHDLVPRRTALMRKSAGRGSGGQIVAANVDTAFIVQGLDRDFNLRRLERYLVMAYDGGVEPMVLLSKQDLQSDREVQARVQEVESITHGAPVLSYSALDDSGVDVIESRIQPGQTFCLVGSSGVGKSTLINRLLGESLLATRAVREKDSRGRHTTARRELILLNDGGILIDTPGMRELGVWAEPSSLETAFPEIEALTQGCRYRGCGHQQEPDCAVRAAVESGDLPQARYDSYIKLAQELANHAMRSDELGRLKRKRAQKQLSKAIKQVKQRKPGF
ncbi:MAG: ribosome small subunit-dependent GTPase A [Fidelibacterota bacterium]|nr:MAG: ribosome small subunit-dependent GTPase A [Candidatus Neomarinimicrobiota bacterium]